MELVTYEKVFMKKLWIYNIEGKQFRNLFFFLNFLVVVSLFVVQENNFCLRLFNLSPAEC